MLVTSKLASLVLELIFLLTGNRLFAESNQVCQVTDKKPSANRYSPSFWLSCQLWCGQHSAKVLPSAFQ